MLRANIIGLVKTIPARYSRIVAQIAKLSNVAKFYGLVGADSIDETGSETFDGTIGLLRYMIAYGDTSVQAYQTRVGHSTFSERELEAIEKDKYLIYNQFE